MILTRYFLLTLFVCFSTTALAAACEEEEDFSFKEKQTRWEFVLLQQKTYVNHVVTSQIGEFRLQVVGGIYQYQQFEFDQYVCNLGPMGDCYRYTQKEFRKEDPAEEEVTGILVIFPNDFQIKITKEDLKNTKYQITTQGLKENSPFAPKGVLSAKDAILVIGKLKLSTEDSNRLNEIF